MALKDGKESRTSIRAGIVIGGQRIDPATDEIVSDYHRNTHGAVYDRLELEEAILFQTALNTELGDDFDALAKKVRAVAVRFGLEQTGGNVPRKPNK